MSQFATSSRGTAGPGLGLHAADADLSFEYLREVLERSDRPEELLLGLRRIAEAQGISRVAQPRLSTLVAVLRVAGLKMSVRPAA